MIRAAALRDRPSSICTQRLTACRLTVLDAEHPAAAVDAIGEVAAAGVDDEAVELEAAAADEADRFDGAAGLAANGFQHAAGDVRHDHAVFAVAVDVDRGSFHVHGAFHVHRCADADVNA